MIGIEQMLKMSEQSALISTVVLSCLRMFGVTLIFPLLSRQSVGGALIKNGLCIIFSYPVLQRQLTLKILEKIEDPSILSIALIVAQELSIGLIIGFCAAIPFWALDTGCFLLDTLRGSSMASAMNPLLGSNSSGLGLFFSHLISVFFLESGGLQSLLRALYESFETVPMGKFFNFYRVDWLSFVQSQWNLLFSLSLSFALPAVVMMILIDIGLGLLNRAASQLNVFFIAMPIKSALCIFLMAISLEFVLSIYLEQMQSIASSMFTFWKNVSK